MFFKNPFAITEGNKWHLSCKSTRCFTAHTCMNVPVCVLCVCGMCMCEKDRDRQRERDTERKRRGKKERRSRRGSTWFISSSFLWIFFSGPCRLNFHSSVYCSIALALTWFAFWLPAESAKWCSDRLEVLEKRYQSFYVPAPSLLRGRCTTFFTKVIRPPG